MHKSNVLRSARCMKMTNNIEGHGEGKRRGPVLTWHAALCKQPWLSQTCTWDNEFQECARILGPGAPTHSSTHFEQGLLPALRLCHNIIPQPPPSLPRSLLLSLSPFFPLSLNYPQQKRNKNGTHTYQEVSKRSAYGVETDIFQARAHIKTL